MSGSKVRIMAQVAMLASLFGVLGIINIYTGSFFDIIFAYTQTSKKMIVLNDKTHQNSIVCKNYLCYN